MSPKYLDENLIFLAWNTHKCWGEIWIIQRNTFLIISMYYWCAYNYNYENEIWFNATEYCVSFICHPWRGRDKGREGKRPYVIILEMSPNLLDFYSQWILIWSLMSVCVEIRNYLNVKSPKFHLCSSNRSYFTMLI